MIEIDEIKKLANILMFEMNEEELKTTQKEFGTILKQMELISNIKGIDKVEPMSFPFELEEVELNEDEVDNVITTEEALLNSKNNIASQVVVPKVVE